MSELRRFFTDHRNEFDDAEPAHGHFERFEARLKQASGKSFPRIGNRLIYRIAASLLLLLTLSGVLYELKTNSLHSDLGTGYRRAELPAEISEAILYYDGLALKQLLEIETIAGTNERARDLSQSARKEINALDENTAMLKLAFLESPGNERILAALVQNQQMKEKITSTILDQMNQYKKQ